VLGFFLLIVPGLILAASPTVFLYVAATMGIRLALPMAPGVWRNLAAFGIALVLGWASMQPFRFLEMQCFEAVLQPDVLPAEPVRLHGHVRREGSGRFRAAKSLPVCDPLCAALLDSGAVQTVTMADAGGETTVGLRSAAAYPEPGLFPEDAGLLARRAPGIPVREQRQQKKAVEARWVLRLATEERLVALSQDAAGKPDWVLRRTEIGGQEEPLVRRLEILDGGGEVRYRKSYVRHYVPAMVFHLGFDGGSAASGFQGAGFHLGRSKQESGDRAMSGDLEPLLIRAIGLEPATADTGWMPRLRREVAVALADSLADAARLEMARRWLSLFAMDAEAADLPLIAKVVADERVHDVATLLPQLMRKEQTPALLREAYAKRILMEHSTEQDRLLVAERLAAMPQGTFARPNAADLAIWSDPELRRQAAPFVARIADMGDGRAAPLLLGALEAATEIQPWNKRRPLIEGVRNGFVELGEEAAVAVPRVRELFLQRPSPLMHNAGDADAWRMALLRMGVALDDLPFFPNQDARMQQRIKRDVQRRLETWQKKRRTKQAAD
jgi:hypothetical protein